MIKKKLNKNARKAAKSTWMMDYTKLNNCVLWIHPWQNERKWSVNNSWSCILRNLRGDRLQIVINTVFAAFVGIRESETLPAPSWKEESTECQRLLAFHYGELQRDEAVIVYIHRIYCFGMLRSSQILSGSSLNEMSCYCPGECGRNIPYISAHKGCHNLVYGCLWSSVTEITEDFRPKIIDALLTLIFKMG